MQVLSESGKGLLDGKITKAYFLRLVRHFGELVRIGDIVLLSRILLNIGLMFSYKRNVKTSNSPTHFSKNGIRLVYR
jgi:hypothetical protein